MQKLIINTWFRGEIRRTDLNILKGLSIETAKRTKLTVNKYQKRKVFLIQCKLITKTLLAKY